MYEVPSPFETDGAFSRFAGEAVGAHTAAAAEALCDAELTAEIKAVERRAARMTRRLLGTNLRLKEYQQARKDSQFRAEQKSQRDGSGAKAKSEGVDTIEILKKISAAGDREKAFWPDSGILMLGAAAIGKSTQLKRFALLALELGMVPVLILVIELVRLKERAGGDGGLNNVIQGYLESQHGPRGSKQYRLLMQAVLERRCLFLVDGVDEAGGAKEEIERAIADELLDQGHKTIVTSRHSGFKMESFERCQLVELLARSRAPQEAVVGATFRATRDTFRTTAGGRSAPYLILFLPR